MICASVAFRHSTFQTHQTLPIRSVTVVLMWSRSKQPLSLVNSADMFSFGHAAFLGDLQAWWKNPNTKTCSSTLTGEVYLYRTTTSIVYGWRFALWWIVYGWRFALWWIVYGWRFALRWIVYGWRFALGWIVYGWRFALWWIVYGWRFALGWIVYRWKFALWWIIFSSSVLASASSTLSLHTTYPSF